jgi:uncharacterized protein
MESERAVRVGRSRHGRGVFATRDVAEGEIVEVCPTLELHEDEVAGRLLDYVFDSGYDPHAVVLPLGYGMLYNHASPANIEYVEHDEDAIAYVAVRDIRAGEELTIDYGGEWWETRGQEPD